MGVTIDEILVGDPPEAWTAAGFTVDDDGTCRIGSVRVRLVGRDGGKRILGWSLRGAPAARLAAGSLDGLPTTASDVAPTAPGVHPNGATYIDHVVLLSPDLGRTTAAIEALGAVPVPDQLRIARMKRRKLALRDEIVKIEARILPDIIA